MKPRMMVAALLGAAAASAALATEDTSVVDNQAMEHVEVIGYPAPLATQAADSDPEQLAEQLRQQQRQELLKAARDDQLQQLETFRLEGERLTADALAQQQEQVEESGDSLLELKQESGEPPLESQSEETLAEETQAQEPS
ncbi:hypothetical protein PVT68_11000 [Microbulbifer bruguierae]|uniref:Uncharacterized protein n=1 Tax=Microbulbifer bruguierae TaxID=3029061 RepID=A0ABY8N9L1_9GAMM|nr:hypothetical protein [Microbulbifer bruguierae]WGL15297.1 hypothetical protein PVT68_11000 [Microbulbifer bruguierae]